MGFFFNMILIAIFIYVLYRVIAGRKMQNKDPYQNKENDPTPDVKEDDSVQKKIDMSDVEDADYKEVD